MPNHYETLGIDRAASADEIKKAYRALSLKWHPDRNSSEEAQSKFQEINMANEILSDEQRRQEYNDELDGRRPFMQQHEFHMDMTDFVHMMFAGGLAGGGGGGVHFFPGAGGHAFFSQQLQKPPPIVKELEVTLEQAYTGCAINVAIERWVIGDNNLKVTELETIAVPIAQGIDNNEIIVLRDAGNRVHETLKGDIKFVVRLVPHATFVRQGIDLVYKKTLSLKEALCGFSVELFHLTGKHICIKNELCETHEVVRPGQRRPIPGLGMHRQGQVGQLIVEFDVQFPANLSVEHKMKLADIL